MRDIKEDMRTKQRLEKERDDAAFKLALIFVLALSAVLVMVAM